MNRFLLKHVPNMITLARAPLFLLTILLISNKYYLLAFTVFLTNEFFDKLDGYVAKKFDLVSDFGRFFDQNVDRFIHLGLFIQFLILFKELSFLLILLLMFRDTLLMTLRIIAFAKKITLTAPNMFKMKNVVEFLALIACFWGLIFKTPISWDVANILLVIGIILGYTNLVLYYKKYISSAHE